MITISDKASKHIIELMVKSNMSPETHNLRVGVNGSGCAGLSYKMDFDENINQGDEIFEDKGIKIICDMKSFLYLFGTELDYSDGLNGKGFTWNNPNATRNCGCGNSFSV